MYGGREVTDGMLAGTRMSRSRIIEHMYTLVQQCSLYWQGVWLHSLNSKDRFFVFFKDKDIACRICSVTITGERSRWTAYAGRCLTLVRSRWVYFWASSPQRCSWKSCCRWTASQLSAQDCV